MIEQHEFHSWNAFKADFPTLFGGTQPLMKRFAFRGLAHADWDLTSSFDRAYRGDDGKRQEVYRNFLSFFRVLNRRMGKQLPEADDEVAAIAQHYGMPTRLLDWSLSPYAAAFFAFYYAKVDRVRCSHVAIWGMDVPAMRLAADPRHFEIVRSRDTSNARIHRQLGSFVAARGSHFNLQSYVSERKSPSAVLFRCIIPSRFVDDALNDLILMGQTPADIYPDFEGVAKYVRLRMAFEGFQF